MNDHKDLEVGDIASRAKNLEVNNSEEISLNVGPSHPSTHGVLRLKMKLNGLK